MNYSTQETIREAMKREFKIDIIFRLPSSELLRIYKDNQ